MGGCHSGVPALQIKFSLSLSLFFFFFFFFSLTLYDDEWLDGVFIIVLDLRSTGRGFNSRPMRFRAATLGKPFTHTCLCYRAV